MKGSLRSALTRLTRLSAFTAAACLLATLVFQFGTQAEPSSQLQRIDAREVVSRLAESLAEGRRPVAERIKALGAQSDVSWITGRRADGGFHPAGFSAQTLIEHAYQSAETGVQGDGQRLLAVLRADAAKRSAALATEPSLSFLSAYSDADLKKPFKFAAIDTTGTAARTRPLTPAVEKAIEILADHLSNGHVGQFRRYAQKHFRNPKFTTERLDGVLGESFSAKDAIVRMFREGLPPPSAQRASLGLLGELAGRSAASAIDPTVAQVIESLNTELPPELERYVSVEDDIASRRSQLGEAERGGGRGKIKPPTNEDILRLIAASSVSGGNPQPGAPTNPPGPSGQPPGRDGFGPWANADSSGPKGPNPPMPGGGPIGGGSPGPQSRPPGGAATEPAPSQFAKNYSEYVQRSFEPRSSPNPRSTPAVGGEPPVPRAYKVAIRSARAARGIAVGAELESRIQGRLARAYWVPNEKDARFGQIIVTVEDDGWVAQILKMVLGRAPKQRTITSRVMFGDSFYAAASSLWGHHGGEAEFHDGEILVVMSMDPASPILKIPLASLQNEAQSKLAQLKEQLRTAKTKAEAEKIVAEAKSYTLQLEERRSKIPRGVVVHPALEGRELAWSAIRIDFSFNVLDRLEAEAMKVNGGLRMPSSLKELKIGQARTWQFYERPVFLHAVSGSDGKERLVASADRALGAATTRESRFAISMFAYGEPDSSVASERVEDGVYRLPRLEEQAQRLLDWLFAYHPDYWRLNDFSEAFSILRWIKASGAPVTILDMHGEAPTLLTPDRIFHGVAEPRIGP